MIVPQYRGGSIINLMSSIVAGLDGPPSLYDPLAALPPARMADAKSIILLVVDGLGYDYLCQSGRGSRIHEHLEARITTTFPPTTATAIPCFFTGAAPQQHGFTGWFTWFRELGSVLAVLPFKARYGGEPLGECGIRPQDLTSQPPIVDRIPARSYLVTPARIARSHFNRAFSGKAEVRPYRSLADCCASLAAIVAARVSRQYIYAYWPEFDSLAHEYGVGSVEVGRHFADLDGAISRLVSKLSGSDTLMIITADHGFIDSGPERRVQLADHPRLEETLILPLCGEPRLAYCYVHPHRRQQFEDYVTSELATCTTLFRSEELMRAGYFGLGQPDPRLRDRIGHYALAMKENYVIKDWILGEKPYQHIGVHGGVSEAEMYVPLAVVAL